MTPEILQEELVAAGLDVLGVGRHRSDASVAMVYLEGLKGQWVEGHALGIIRSVPGVKKAAESVRTPAIVLVWMEEVF